jgi:hypothetical protein
MAIAAGQAAAETTPLSARELAAVVRDVADTTPIVDMHTHLFSESLRLCGFFVTSGRVTRSAP